MRKNILIKIVTFTGPKEHWNNLPKVLGRDLKNLGISGFDVIIRRNRYCVNFKTSEDLHLAILSGVLIHKKEYGLRGLEKYHWISQLAS